MKNKVLVIEDNKDMLENISEIIELAGYDVISAENGKVGLKAAMESTPDLILCDIMMPELDGYGVLKIISDHPILSQIPFIFMSAKSEKADFREGMRLGADDYLMKPFEDVQLLEAIEMRLKKGGGNGNHSLNAIQNITSFNLSKAEKDFEELFADKHEEHFDKKDNLFKVGNSPRYIFLITSGIVKTSMFNEDGKELIVGLYSDNQILGLTDVFSNESYNETAKFIEKGTCLRITKEDFLQAIYQNRDLAMLIYTKLNFSVNIRKERLIQLAYDSVRKRSADALLWINDILNKENEYPFTLQFNREDLAAMVGTAKESLIRTLSSFKEDNLIDVKSGNITINSAQQLRNIIA